MILKDTAGKEFQISECDLDFVLSKTWRIDDLGYVRGSHPERKRLHQYLMGNAPEGFEIDHINRDRADCRRENLRIVSLSEQLFNRGVRKDNTSGMPGVFQTRSGKWQSRIHAQGQCITLGTFKSFEKACAARLAAEQKYHPTGRS